MAAGPKGFQRLIFRTIRNLRHPAKKSISTELRYIILVTCRTCKCATKTSCWETVSTYLMFSIRHGLYQYAKIIRCGQSPETKRLADNRLMPVVSSPADEQRANSRIPGFSEFAVLPSWLLVRIGRFSTSDQHRDDASPSASLFDELSIWSQVIAQRYRPWSIQSCQSRAESCPIVSGF